MAYNFKVTQVAVPFVAEMASQLPILLNSNKQLDKEYKAGTGSTITMVVPDYPTVTSGPTVDPAALAYQSGSRTLTLVQEKVAIAADQVSRALDIHSFEDQVAKPYSQRLASVIQGAAAQKVQLESDHQSVISSTGLFGQVGQNIASIRQARSYGEICAALDPVLEATIAASGITYFNPSKEISDLFLKSSIGMYGGAQFYRTPDVGGIDTGDLVLSAGAAVKTAITVDGTTTLVIVDAGHSGDTVVKGQGFSVAGVKTVDIYGKSTGFNYIFVAQENASINGNDLTITVKPVYFSKPLQNVSTTTIAQGAIVTPLQAASKSYRAGIIWDKQSLLFGSASLAPMAGTESKVIADPKGLSVTTTRGPDILGGREVVRWDVLTGFALARTNWASTVWFQL